MTDGVDSLFLELIGEEEEEEQDLNDSHDWGEKRFFDGDGMRIIPVCLDCKVNGFINEPKAFRPCPGPKKPRSRCRVMMWSADDPGHRHRCIGGHDEGDHFCKECGRWYNVIPGSPLDAS